MIPLALSGHTDIMDMNLFDDFIHNLELASFFGCKYFVTSIGKPNPSEDIIRRIEELYPYLEKYDLELMIELHGQYRSGRVLHEIVKHCDDRVHTNYDTGNAIFYGDMDDEMLLEDIESNIDDIAYMHIKDKAGKRNEWNFPAIGQGYVPLPSVFNILEEHNNAATLCVEIEFTPEGPKDINEVDKAVEDSARYLNSLGFKL